MHSIAVFTERGRFLLKFHYHPLTVAIVKSIPGRMFDGSIKTWTFPATASAAGNIHQVFKERDIVCIPDAKFKVFLSQYREGQRVLTHPEEVELPDSKTPLFDHQKAGLRLLMVRNAVYLAWQMGTGKTLPVTVLCEEAEMKRVLVACPKSVIDSWPVQFERHTHGPYRCLPLRKGSVKKRLEEAQKFLARGPGAVILNHEAVWREPFGPWALEQDWDLVVVDEAHRISEARTKVSSFFASLRPRARKRVALSGTPIPNTPLSLFGQMKFLDPGLFGTSFMSFRNRYAVMGGWRAKEVVAFKNLDDLHEKFYTVAHRVTKEEALDLPETVDEKMTFELSPSAQKIYNSVEGSFKTQIDKGTITAANALVELLRLQQITGGTVGTDQKTKQKVDEGKEKLLTEYLQNVNDKEPIIVFCRFHSDLEAVHRASHKAGRESLELSGRKNDLIEWQNPDELPKVLAVQIQAGGVGVDMTRSAYCVYYSLGFSYADYEQSRARLDRQGQTRSVTFTHLIAEKTVDKKVYQVLQKKGNVIQEILKDFS